MTDATTKQPALSGLAYTPTPATAARARAVLARHAAEHGWTDVERTEAERTLGIEEKEISE